MPLHLLLFCSGLMDLRWLGSDNVNPALTLPAPVTPVNLDLNYWQEHRCRDMAEFSGSQRPKLLGTWIYLCQAWTRWSSWVLSVNLLGQLSWLNGFFGKHNLCHEAHVYIRILQAKYNGQQHHFEPAIITDVLHQNSLVCSRLQQRKQGLKCSTSWANGWKKSTQFFSVCKFIQLCNYLFTTNDWYQQMR